MNKHLEYFIVIVFMPGSNLVVSVDDTSRIASVLNDRSPFDQTKTESRNQDGDGDGTVVHDPCLID